MSEQGAFDPGHGPEIPVPDAFFSVVLPQIDSLAELKVTLHLYWLLSKQRGLPKAVSLSELEGLELAVTRGDILLLSLGAADHPLQRWYLLNTPESRAALDRLVREEISPSEAIGQDVGPVEVVRVYRPNIFTLYERNIGVLTPLIVDGLRDAELAYPMEWVVEAMRLAVEYNRRSWAYVASILKRWETEGKSGGTDRRYPETPLDQEKYTGGRYGHLVES